MLTSNTNGLNQMQNGMKKGEVVGAVVGVVLFALSVYAFSLSIKVNKLMLKKLKNDGYE